MAAHEACRFFSTGLSGLGINEDKTRVISARSSDISSSLSACPWKEVKLAPSYKYLGILIDRSLEVADISEVPLAGYIDRAARFLPAFRTLSHANRVLAYTVFSSPNFLML